jgi:hypothetical protein
VESNSPNIDDLFEICLMMKARKSNYFTVINVEFEGKVEKTILFIERLEIFDFLFQLKKNINENNYREEM